MAEHIGTRQHLCVYQMILCRKITLLNYGKGQRTQVLPCNKKNVYISTNQKQRRSNIQEVQKQTYPEPKKRVGDYQKSQRTLMKTEQTKKKSEPTRSQTKTKPNQKYPDEQHKQNKIKWKFRSAHGISIRFPARHPLWRKTKGPGCSVFKLTVTTYLNSNAL